MSKRNLFLGVMVVSVLMLVSIFGTGMVIANTDDFRQVSNSNQEQRKSNTDHNEEMQAQCEEQINSAAEAGKITPEQKQAILDKQAELHKDMEKLEDLSPEKRQAAMVKMMSEMKSWAADKGIDLDSFMGHGNGHMSMGAGCSADMMQDMDSMMDGERPMMSGAESMM